MHRLMAALLSPTILLAWPVALASQAVETRSIQTIALDPSTGLREVVLPFQEQFLLSVPVAEHATEVEVSVVPVTPGLVGLASATFRPEGGIGKSTVSFLVPELASDQVYAITLRYWLVDGSSRVGADCRPLGNQPKARECIEESFLGVTDASFIRHFDTDFGLIHAPTDVGLTGVVVAVHFHLDPINKNTPQGLVDGGVLSKVSLFAGFSIAQLGSSAPVEKPSSVGMPTVGLGLRILDPIRIIGGAVFFEQVDANPIVDDRRSKWATFFGLTLDLELKSILGPVAGLLGVK